MTDASAHAEKINFIWSVKEILRDHYRRHQYGEVILPLCAIRRLDCELVDTKEKVVARAGSISGNVDTHADELAHIAGHPFYNSSKFTFETLLGDQHHIVENVFDYLNKFSPNARFALEKFGIGDHINRMGEAGILYMVIQRFAGIDLSPGVVPNVEMGYIYEELIRVNAELSNEEAGEHFTPREVIRLMVDLLFADEDQLLTPGKIATIYDPACGTGGMLSVAEEYLVEKNPQARLHLFGQELQPESYAICQTDMMIKNEQNARIVYGDSFAQDGFEGMSFDYMLANPPYGKDWKTIERFIKAEHATKGFAGRFGAGLPSTADGQILFLQQMISKMRPAEQGGSRVGIVMNGSPLFSGDAGSGLSEIRRWIVENDWLEVIVGLPDQLFYNTGIHTYVWILTNRKRPERRGYVQMIDARQLFSRMRKNLGKKRNELSAEHISEVGRLYESFVESDLSTILPNSSFGYRKVTIERPLRVRYGVSDGGLRQLRAVKAVQNWDEDRRECLLSELARLQGTSWPNRDELESALGGLVGVGKLPAPIKNAIVAALSIRDPEAEPSLGQPDPSLREVENVPLVEDVQDYFKREIAPHFPDAWIASEEGKIGYEIPFTRQFFRYEPPRELGIIDAEIRASEQRILAMLAQVTE